MDELNGGLIALQNRYREMEAEIRLAQDDSVQTIKMQQEKISKLRQDNNRVKSELEMETNQAKGCFQKTGSTSIAALQSEGDYYKQNYQAESQQINELNREITELEKQILQQDKEEKKDNSRQSGQSSQKQIRMLENRLDKANVKYNEALGHNKKLRETIENLRRDRAVFDGIHDKLQSDLETKKGEMGDIMDDAMSAYEARIQAQVEMVKFREQGDKDTSKFQKEWKELNREMEECQQRHIMEQKNAKALNGGSVVDDVLEEERELKKNLSKATLQVINDKVAIQKAEEQVQYYRDAFARIQKETGITDIDALVQNFEAADKENFRLFNEANNLNKEIERLELQTSNVTEQIAKVQGDGFNADTQRKKILDDLQKKLDNTESKIKFYDEKYSKCLTTVDSLKSGVRDILLCMNAERVDPDVIERVNSVGINESNLMEFLAVIEKRTNHLIEQYLAHDGERATTFVRPKKIDSSTAANAMMGVGVGDVGDDLMIIPPTTLSNTRDDEFAQTQTM